MKFNLKFIIILAILFLAILFGTKALTKSNKLSADVENQTDMINDLNQ